MQYSLMLRHILNDEAMTRGLGDVEARMLVEWLVDWAELLAENSQSDEQAWNSVQALSRRARAISRFVILWGSEQSRRSATQLAGAERFSWPLPSEHEEPEELMARILAWEDRHLGF